MRSGALDIESFGICGVYRSPWDLVLGTWSGRGPQSLVRTWSSVLGRSLVLGSAVVRCPTLFLDPFTALRNRLVNVEGGLPAPEHPSNAFIEHDQVPGFLSTDVPATFRRVVTSFQLTVRGKRVPKEL